MGFRSRRDGEATLLLTDWSDQSLSLWWLGGLFPQPPEPSAARVGFGAKPQGLSVIARIEEEIRRRESALSECHLIFSTCLDKHLFFY